MGGCIIRKISSYFPIIIICVALLGITIATPWLLARRSTFFGRPSLGGVPLRGMTRTQAAAILRRQADQLSRKSLTLHYRKERWNVTPVAIGIRADYRPPLQKLWRVGREGSVFRRWREILFPPRLSLLLAVQMRSSAVRTRLFHLKPEIERDPVNASFDIATGALIPEEWGRKLNMGSTRPGLIRAILSNRTENRRANLIFRGIPPKTTTRQLKATRVRTLISTYSTVFDPDVHVRAANIRRGAQQLNGVLIPSGKIFSFNTTTGPRTTDNGYGAALEIVNKRYVPGVGGGICQVSSTLYNAVLLAGLPVLERSAHSLPLGYVPLGRDSTVYYPHLDLKFRNKTGGNILILSEVTGNRITVALLAEEAQKFRVELQTKILETLAFVREEAVDPELAPGERQLKQPGQKGYKVRTRRFYYLPDGSIEKEELSVDTYRSQPELVRVAPPVSRKSMPAPIHREPVPWWRFIFPKAPGASEPPRTEESPQPPTR